MGHVFVQEERIRERDRLDEDLRELQIHPWSSDEELAEGVRELRC